MAIGDVTKIIPAQAFKISRIAEELILTEDVIFRGSHVVTTTNTRAGPLYTFQWRRREIEAVIALTEDLQTQLEADNLLDVNSALPLTNYVLQGLSISDDIPDNVLDTYAAHLLDYSNLAPESGEARARIKLLIAGTAT